MNIQVITFSLDGLSEQDYLRLIESAAPAFAELPGLVSKTWLANAETNTYGGVYLWQDRESMEGYAETDVFKQMAANPNFKNFTVREFDVPEGASRITRGLTQATAGHIAREASSRSRRPHLEGLHYLVVATF